MSVAETVRNYIQNRPFLEEALAREIVNYKSLAVDIKTDIENEMGKEEVSTSSIMMSLRREAEKLSEQFTSLTGLTGLMKGNSDIKLFNSIYGLIEITVERGAKINEKISQVYEIVNIDEGDFLTITQGMYEITIITNREYYQKLCELFGEDQVIQEGKDLASISLKIPKSGIEQPGIIYQVTKQLFWDNINIVEVVSTFTELTFVLSEMDIPAAMNTLRKLSR